MVSEFFLFWCSRLSKVGKLCRAVPNFESIRPYRDEEVPSVVRRLIASAELRDGFASFVFPRLYKFSAVATRLLTRIVLGFRVKKLKTVHDVQTMVGRFIDHMLEASVDELSWSGLNDLDPGTPYLFVSNHRDITLDSALLSRVLHGEGFPTCQIAVGDNLFGTPHADDLMRLNRGFLVQRAAGGPKAVYAALMSTSSYIRHSIESGASVWIAQRQGRAKDGFDRTEPALIKMLALAWRKPRLKSQAKRCQDEAAITRLDELLNRMQIVPVAISYELDPCDLLKADELYHTAVDGSFTKAEGADLASIVQGMRGYKGRVHLNFSKPLKGSYESAEEISLAMDKAIVGGLNVYPPNLSAQALSDAGGQVSFAQASEGSDGSDGLEGLNASKALRTFEERVAEMSTEKRPYLLMQYANLLRNRAELGLDETSTTQTQITQTSSR